MKTEKELLSKIVVCLYILIVMVSINTIINVITSVDSKKAEATETTENEDYDVSMFKEVTISELLTEIEKDETNVIYMGRSTCGYCVKFLPSLQKAQKEYDYQTLYVDITKVDDKSDDFKALQDILTMEYTSNGVTDKFSTFYGYTPMMVITKNNKMVSGTIGYMEYDEFASWLEDNGLKK